MINNETERNSSSLSSSSSSLLSRSNDSVKLGSSKLTLIKLNVGGKRYVTTESTLISKGDNFFTAMLEKIKEGTMNCIIDEEGYIFIDRNGSAFESVLEYLRTGALFLPPGITKEQVAIEFDFYSIQRIDLETESYKLAHHSKWNNLAQQFFDTYWSSIRDKLYEMVHEHGLNSCSLTIVFESILGRTRSEEDKIQRYYNNIKISINQEVFGIPLKPLFLDNVIYIFRDFGFESSYIHRQQTVDISLNWYQKSSIHQLLNNYNNDRNNLTSNTNHDDQE